MDSGVIETGYRPRPLQAQLHNAMRRFNVLVMHRRFGKTVMCINDLIDQAVRCPRERPRYAYISPLYRQSKQVAWDYLKHYTRAFPDVGTNEAELRVDFGDARIQLFGADNPDSLRGIYLDGVVLDEYAQMPDKLWSEVIRPCLTDREGGATFIGTPKGRNTFWNIYDETVRGERGPEWFAALYRASETGILADNELRAAKRDMTEDEYEQEFECSFEASVQGAIFTKELRAAREQGRITDVPYDPMLRVDTDWDLGVGDSTAIWFTQSHDGGKVAVIDYYEASGEGLAHYVKVLSEKPYAYGTHWAPHDIQVRELGVGKSRLSIAGDLGLYFQVVPRINTVQGQEVEEGINAARMLMGKCWFDETRTARGLEALQHYRRDFNSRINEFKATPVHDWASHGADAFRGLAVRHLTPSGRRPRELRNFDQVEKKHQDMLVDHYWHKPQKRSGPGRGGY